MANNRSHLINGDWVASESIRDIINPANESVVDTIAYADAELAGQACDAAAQAFPSWSKTLARKRADIMAAGAAKLSERADEIGRLLAAEAGKRLPEGVGEVKGAVEYMRWFAEEARRPHGQMYPHEAEGRRHLSVARPAGVAASLTPWNFPVSIQARKIAPALMAGCTVVARASEKAPLAVIEMFRCLQEAGLPAGALNLVHGPAGEITETFLGHPAVRVVSFTGSTAIGRRILKTAADRIVRPLMELGGDWPFIVFDDVDIDEAVEAAMVAKFRNTGQSCIGANRFIVQDTIFDEFTARFAERINAMTVGDGLADPVPDLGPCIDAARVDEVNRMVAEAVGRGARKLTRDFDLCSKGHYCAPALLVEVPDDCAMAREEVFGPASAVFTFKTEEEALARANDTEMGLSSYLMTQDQRRIWRMADGIDAGILGVNDPVPVTPFIPMGGTKQSGLGREGARIGLEEFQETQYMSLRYSVCEEE